MPYTQNSTDEINGNSRSLKAIKSFDVVIDSEKIYNFRGRIESVKKRIRDYKEGSLVIEFLDILPDCGLSKGRIAYYAARLPRIIEWFASKNISLRDANKDHCKACLRESLLDSYAGETKVAYATVLKRLIHFAKTEEVGEKKDNKDYVQEVAWIRPSIYLKHGARKGEIKPSDILTSKEFENLIEAIPKVSRYSVRDKAMIMCMYEGAFRPGELLRMSIGGTLFKDKIAVITTTGKTGSKTVPLLFHYFITKSVPLFILP